MSEYLRKDFEVLLNRILTKTSDKSKENIVLVEMKENYLAPEENKKLKSTFDLF